MCHTFFTFTVHIVWGLVCILFALPICYASPVLNKKHLQKCRPIKSSGVSTKTMSDSGYSPMTS